MICFALFYTNLINKFQQFQNFLNYFNKYLFKRDFYLIGAYLDFIETFVTVLKPLVYYWLTHYISVLIGF